MGVENPNVLHAMASVACAAGGQTFTSNRGFGATITDNGPGDFSLDLTANAIDSTEVCWIAEVNKATCAAVTVVHVSDTEVRVRTWTCSTDAALDNVSVWLVGFKNV